MYKCKITVLKRMVNQDLIDQYMGDEFRAKQIDPLGVVKLHPADE